MSSSNDKRRRARVQGGWASGSNPQKNALMKNKAFGNANNEKQTVSQSESNFRSQSNKPSTELERSKNSNTRLTRQSQQKFVFQDLEEDIKVKPKEQVITQSGVYNLSSEPSGISRIQYYPNFVDASRAEVIFAQLFSEVGWQQYYDKHNGQDCIQPRLSAWYADTAYEYGGIKVQPNRSEWPNSLKVLNDQLIEKTGVDFNTFVANLYRDGHDGIGWHSDDEPIMGKNPVIASVSFGEERVFELRKKPPPNENGERDYTYSEVYKVPLRSGDLLIMEGSLQDDWQHRVPKEYHDRGARINVTFRTVYPTSIRVAAN